MLDKIIYFSIKNKFIIGLITASMVLLGIYSLSRLPIDALPDITNNQVQILTLTPTLATQEVEQLITYPIEQAVKSIPKVVELRSVSKFGLSSVTVVFEEHVEIYWARAQISERLKEAEDNIAPGLGIPEMAPISTGLGEIYQYTVYTKSGYEDKIPATELRSVQDWIVKPQLLGIKGVAEVNTLGGLLKEYEIAIEPDKLKSMNTNIIEIFDALRKNNENTGGAYIDKKPNAYFIRGIGMISSLHDIEKIVVKNQNGIPILIRDVAQVQLGSAVRYGATTKDGKGEAVTGMVMMLKGENSADIVRSVKDRVLQIQKTLPEGVVIEPYLDRTKMVNNAISTVRTNLLEGALIVLFILVLLIGNWRAGLIVASVIPLALLFAVILMHAFGVSGNLMSLGAIDFGLIVDGAVIIVEAIVHRLQTINKGKLTAAQMDAEVYGAASKIRSSAAFGEIIILIVYLPILALVGIEGKMFKPMAQTVSFAILGAFILSLTYVPMMSALFLSRSTEHKRNISDVIMDFLYRLYQPVLEVAIKKKATIILFSVGLFVVAFIVFKNMGGEFIPTLEEGDIATHIITPPGTSLAQEIETTTKAEAMLLKNFPEVEQVVSKIGSAEIPTDPMPMEVADVMIILKPKSEWTSANNKEEMMAKMDKVLNDLPGVTTEFTQPVQMRFNELMTGVRSDVAIKIFGEDIELLAGLAEEVVPIVQSVRGVEDARAEQVSGLPQITIRYNKDKLALYGLNVGDLNQVVRSGFAGEKAGVVYEGEKRFNLVVRIAKDNRQNIEQLKNLFIPLPSGDQVPLEQVADITYERGAAMISRENGKRRIVIGFNVRGRDVESVVNEIQGMIESKVKLPVGYYTTYGGQFQNLVQASNRLSIAVPVALALIFVLLFFTFHSIKQSLLIFTAIPLSAIGGIFALWIRDMPFSISAGIGFIALFGVAVLNGIVLIGYFNQLKTEGITDVMDRIRIGTKVRLRPVVMTAAVASLGFLPMAISMGAGAEVQKPLATVVIGGLITATLLTLIVLPILYLYFEKGIKRHSKSINTGVIIIVVSLFGTIVIGQKTLNLQQAIDIALQNNLQIQASGIHVAIQTQLKGTTYDVPKTEFGSILGQFNSKSTDQYYNISQSINPFLFGPKKSLLAENAKSAELNSNLTKQEIIMNVREVWNNILYFQHLNDILMGEDSLLALNVKAVGLKYKTGEANQLENIMSITRKGDLEQLIKQNKASIEIEKMKLGVLLQIRDLPEITDTKYEAIELFDISDSLALRQNPSMQVALQNIKIAEGQRNLEKAQMKPELKVGYFIQSLTGKQEVNNQIIAYNGVPRFQGATIGLSIPIFSLGSNKAKISALKNNVLLQQKNADIQSQALLTNYEQLIQQLTVAKIQMDYFEKTGNPNAFIINRSAINSYSNGDISYIELLQSMQMARDIRRNYQTAIHQYNQILINLQFLLNQ